MYALAGLPPRDLGDVQGMDLAFEMRADRRMERQTMTAVIRTVNRRLMRDHIGQIAAEYRFTPAP